MVLVARELSDKSALDGVAGLRQPNRGYKVDGKDVAVGDGIKIADDQNIKQGKLGAIFGQVGGTFACAHLVHTLPPGL